MAPDAAGDTPATYDEDAALDALGLPPAPDGALGTEEPVEEEAGCFWDALKPRRQPRKKTPEEPVPAAAPERPAKRTRKDNASPRVPAPGSPLSQRAADGSKGIPGAVRPGKAAGKQGVQHTTGAHRKGHGKGPDSVRHGGKAASDARGFDLGNGRVVGRDWLRSTHAAADGGAARDGPPNGPTEAVSATRVDSLPAEQTGEGRPAVTSAQPRPKAKLASKPAEESGAEAAAKAPAEAPVEAPVKAPAKVPSNAPAGEPAAKQAIVPPTQAMKRPRGRPRKRAAAISADPKPPEAREQATAADEPPSPAAVHMACASAPQRRVRPACVMVVDVCTQTDFTLTSTADSCGCIRAVRCFRHGGGAAARRREEEEEERARACQKVENGAQAAISASEAGTACSSDKQRATSEPKSDQQQSGTGMDAEEKTNPEVVVGAVEASHPASPADRTEAGPAFSEFREHSMMDRYSEAALESEDTAAAPAALHSPDYPKLPSPTPESDPFLGASTGTSEELSSIDSSTGPAAPALQSVRPGGWTPEQFSEAFAAVSSLPAMTERQAQLLILRVDDERRRIGAQDVELVMGCIRGLVNVRYVRTDAQVFERRLIESVVQKHAERSAPKARPPSPRPKRESPKRASPIRAEAPAAPTLPQRTFKINFSTGRQTGARATSQASAARTFFEAELGTLPASLRLRMEAQVAVIDKGQPDPALFGADEHSRRRRLLVELLSGPRSFPLDTTLQFLRSHPLFGAELVDSRKQMHLLAHPDKCRHPLAKDVFHAVQTHFARAKR